MPIAAAANALTTVANVRLMLSRQSSTDSNEADRLQILINSMSQQIRLHTGRQFMPLELGVAKKFRYEGTGLQTFSPWELKQLRPDAAATLGYPGAVTLYTDMPTTGWVAQPDQTATLESSYRLEPRQGTTEGTYLWMVLFEIGMYSQLVPEPLITRRRRGHEVTVVGDWGVGSIPADVELACLIAVVNSYRNPAGFASMASAGMSFAEVSEQGTFGEGGGTGLPRDSRNLLKPYLRSAYG